MTRLLMTLAPPLHFPPQVQEIARLCDEFGVPHVVNNAYGLQCSKITHALNEACRTGRVDLVVQSTDKNFLVPVGGAIIAGPGGPGVRQGQGGKARGPGLVPQVCRMYPGRAGSGPVQVGRWERAHADVCVCGCECQLSSEHLSSCPPSVPMSAQQQA